MKYPILQVAICFFLCSQPSLLGRIWHKNFLIDSGCYFYILVQLPVCEMRLQCLFGISFDFLSIFILFSFELSLGFLWIFFGFLDVIRFFTLGEPVFGLQLPVIKSIS